MFSPRFSEMMMGTKPDPAILRFGAFELAAHNHELRKAGVLMKVQEQPLKLLVLLAERTGELLSRAEAIAGRGRNDPPPCKKRRYRPVIERARRLDGIRHGEPN